MNFDSDEKSRRESLLQRIADTIGVSVAAMKSPKSERLNDNNFVEDSSVEGLSMLFRCLRLEQQQLVLKTVRDFVIQS